MSNTTQHPTIAAYPLQWPGGWPATQNREPARFKTKLSTALNALKREVNLLGGKNLVLSSNVTLGDESPKNPGVCAYFILREQSIAIPCDRWNRVHDNVHAIALTIEAMRGMERWGAKQMITAMFKGFKALPARTGPSCWEVLGLTEKASEAAVIQAYREISLKAHPDKGGTEEQWHALCEAKDLALSTIRNR